MATVTKENIGLLHEKLTVKLEKKDYLPPFEKALKDYSKKANIPGFVKRVKEGEGRLMGFGHRVYKSYDPRAKIIKRMADLVFEVTGKNPWLEIALELERIALEDEYFVSRKLYPNVDFYSGLIYQAMGFPVDMFPVLFAIPRTACTTASARSRRDTPPNPIATRSPEFNPNHARFVDGSEAR